MSEGNMYINVESACKNILIANIIVFRWDELTYFMMRKYEIFTTEDQRGRHGFQKNTNTSNSI